MDIVDDLRELNSMHTPKEVSSIGERAADEIERLRWENANMEKLWGKSEGTWMEIRDKQDAEIERLRVDLDRMASLAIDNAKDTGRAIKYRGALHAIGYGPPNEGEPLDLLNKFVDLARYALKDED